MDNLKLTRWDFYTALGGNILEYYNVTLYGFLAASLAPSFFPCTDPRMSVLISFAAFAMGFIMRPLGGFIFGYMGDKIGHKSGLYYSLLFGSVPSLLISILPSYNTVGLIAPLGLIICRMLQGISIAGEWANISVYLLERAPNGRINFWGSIIVSSGFFGALLSAFSAILVSSDYLPEWGWRLPFFIGGIVSMINVIIRSKLPDSSRNRNPQKNTGLIRSLFSASKFKLLLAAFIAAASSGTFYMSSIYINMMYTLELGLPVQIGYYINLGLMLFWLLLLPLFGKLGDKLGATSLIRKSLYCIAIVSYPAFMLIETREVWSFIAAQALLSIANLGLHACINGFLVSIFNKEHRSSALGIGFNLGTAIFAGPAPVIAIALVKYTGDIKAPALYIMALSLISAALVSHINKDFYTRTRLNPSSI